MWFLHGAGGPRIVINPSLRDATGLTEPQSTNYYGKCLYGLVQVSWHLKPHFQKEQ